MNQTKPKLTSRRLPLALMFGGCLLFGGGTSGWAQEASAVKPATTTPVADAKAKNIRRLLELNGILRRELASIDPIFEHFRRVAPQVPVKIWAELKKEFRAEYNADTIVALYVPIYAAHFNDAELQQLINFYQSPLGQKLIRETPEIEVEAFTVGLERGQKLGARIRDRLKTLGFNLPVA